LRKARRAHALAGILLLAAAARAAPQVEFKRDIVPLLKVRCAVCHLTGDEAFGMALYPGAAYKSLVTVPSGESPLVRVKPGKPDESYLIHKLEGTQGEVGGKGLQMPIDSGPLSRQEIDMIRAWIAEGAKDN
jgi:hypothetical protein